MDDPLCAFMDPSKFGTYLCASPTETPTEILKLIFAGYTGRKNPVRNRLKIQFFELDFSNLIFQKSSTDG